MSDRLALAYLIIGFAVVLALGQFFGQQWARNETVWGQVGWYDGSGLVAVDAEAQFQGSGGVRVVGDATGPRPTYTISLDGECGTATILSGNASVTVPHSLGASPGVALATGRDAETGQIWTSARSASSVTFTVPAPVTADRVIDYCLWR